MRTPISRCIVKGYWEEKAVLPYKALNCIHLLQSSSSELPLKPQVSTPNIGIPNSEKDKA